MENENVFALEDKTLGKGCFGTVYLGLDVMKDKYVALKEIPTAIINDPVKLEILSNEILISTGVESKNLVKIKDITQIDKKKFIVYEYCNGGDLSNYLAYFGYFKEDLIQHFIKQILLGIKALHAKNIIHHDIKPENLLIEFIDTFSSKKLNRVQFQDFVEKVKKFTTTNDGNLRNPFSNNGVYNNGYNCQCVFKPVQNPYTGQIYYQKYFINTNQNSRGDEPLSLENKEEYKKEFFVSPIFKRVIMPRIVENKRLRKTTGCLPSFNCSALLTDIGPGRKRLTIAAAEEVTEEKDFVSHHNKNKSTVEVQIKQINNNKNLLPGDLTVQNKQSKKQPKEISCQVKRKRKISLEVESQLDKEIITNRLVLYLLSKSIVKVSDFGLSKFIGQNDKKLVSGSPLFMGPELFAQDVPMEIVENEKVDIWALGITAYQMFFGRVPFNDPYQNLQTFIGIVTRGVYKIDLNECRTISREFLNFLRLCLQAEQKNRPTAKELLTCDFLTKDPKDFDYIDLNNFEIRNDIKASKNGIIYMNIYETSSLSTSISS